MFYGLRGFNGGVVFFGIEGYVGGDAEGMRGFFAMFSCNLCFCQRFFFFFLVRLWLCLGLVWGFEIGRCHGFGGEGGWGEGGCFLGI